VQRFIADAASKSGVTCDNHDVFVAAAHIATDRHAKTCGQSSAGVSRAVTIVLTLGAQQKSVQPLVLPHRPDPIEPASKHFVDVTLMTDIEDKSIVRRVENPMQRDR